MKTRASDRGEGMWVGKLWGSLLLVVAVVLSSCAAPDMGYAPPAPAPLAEPAAGNVVTPSAEGMRRIAREVAAPEQRPGIATGWGRQVSSRMSYTSFNRASTKPYGGVATINYNDRRGIEAMTGWTSRAPTMVSAAGGTVEWGVKGVSSSLRNYRSGSRRFVEGKEGQRYKLVVKNTAKSRVEVVLSVDGLDVMDGKTASTKKRGYIIDPGKTLEVKGWRTSQDSVASFRFSGVGASYANLKHGNTRNVGVVGLAVFTEKGIDPFLWMPGEVKRRHSASPFAEAPMNGAR